MEVVCFVSILKKKCGIGIRKKIFKNALSEESTDNLSYKRNSLWGKIGSDHQSIRRTIVNGIRYGERIAYYSSVLS